MRINRRINVWRFLLEWVFATALGAAGSLAIAVIINNIIPTEVSFRLWSDTPLRFMIFATTASAIQWRVLRLHVPKSGGWIFATLLASYLVGCAQYATTDFFNRLNILSIPVEVLVQWAIAGVHGAIFGAIQWVVLMPHLRKAWIWIAANQLSFIFGFGMLNLFYSWSIFKPLIWWGTVHALAQAVALVWLLQKAKVTT